VEKGKQMTIPKSLMEAAETLSKAGDIPLSQVEFIIKNTFNHLCTLAEREFDSDLLYKEFHDMFENIDRENDAFEGAKLMHTLDMAALLRAQHIQKLIAAEHLITIKELEDAKQEIARYKKWQSNIEEARASLRSQHKCYHPDEFLYQDEHAKASCWECDWFTEHNRVKELEAALRLALYYVEEIKDKFGIDCIVLKGGGEE
jgi:hypothetical protein